MAHDTGRLISFVPFFTSSSPEGKKHPAIPRLGHTLKKHKARESERPHGYGGLTDSLKTL